MSFDYDVVVIGSGFGGSVAALRLAEKGYRVLVYEAGRRFEDADFPKTNWNVRKYLWAPALGCYGIQRIHLLPDAIILAGAGVGGGSLVDLGSDPIGVGPTSVGSELLSRAMVFGGSELTATDIAVAGGYLELGDRSAVAGLDPAVVAAAVERIRLLVERAADSMRLTADPVPVVVVGGGAALLTTDAFAGQQVLRPEYADVANAVGSAIALAGGEADRIFDLEQMSRQDAIAAASAEATEQCVAAGASPTGVDIVELDVLPLTYLPGRSVRIRVKAAGSPSD